MATADFSDVESLLNLKAALNRPLAGGRDVASFVVPKPDSSAPLAAFQSAIRQSPVASPGSGANDFEASLAEAARIGGFSPAEVEALRTIAKYESSFQNIPQQITDINTQKGTPAYGYYQIIEPTFRANAEPGYEDWRNPVHQALAARNYARSRYGSVESVAERFTRQGHGGY